MQPPLYPSLYQINTRVWLQELSRELGRPASFDDVADSTLDRIAGLGFDWVWFLGVWQTGPAGRAVSLSNPDWRKGYKEILGDYRDEDVAGSPFGIQNYSVHSDFGGEAALVRIRERLAARGLRLLLDFVPNHTALDHPWVQDHPEYYVPGTEEDLSQAPQNYCRRATRRGPMILAHGRDPYFPGWPDSLQLNYRHPGLREAMTGELLKVAGLCDAVRCDMAMLLLPGVFQRTWGNSSLPRDGTAPVDAPFWPAAIARVRKKYPDFRFLAEVYWDLEWTLQQQGFDFTYDKRLYDRLRAQNAAAVRGHLCADIDFQNRLARFLENHDEPRAAGTFPPKVHQAAAILTFLVPGLRFFHEGQFEGRRVHVSIHLGRRPAEPVDAVLQDFYRRLLDCLKRPELRTGRWLLRDCRPAWEGNSSSERFIVFTWEGASARSLLVAVNYGPTSGQCYVPLPIPYLKGKIIHLRDLMSSAKYERNGDDLTNRGLYLDMPEWAYHVFEMVGL